MAEPTQPTASETNVAADQPAKAATARQAPARKRATTKKAAAPAGADAATADESGAVAEQAQETESKPAKKPATRKRAAAKKPAEPATEPAAEPTESASAATNDAAAAKKPATRRRAASKKTAESAEPTAATTEAAVAEAEPAKDPVQEPAPTKKPATRRRAASKKTAAAQVSDEATPAAETAAETAAGAPAESEPSVDEAPAEKTPAKKAPARRRSKKTDAVTESVPESEATAPEAAVEPEAADEPEVATAEAAPASPFDIPTDSFGLLFQEPDLAAVERPAASRPEQEQAEEGTRRRRRRRRGTEDMEIEGGDDGDPAGTVTRVRAPRAAAAEAPIDHVVSIKGSTRLEAKRQRRRDSRESGRRRHGITEAEFLARRESVDRQMVVRQNDQRIQIGVLEDGVLSEHFVSHTTQDSLIGNVYVGKVQNVLPSMEAAFIDIGRGRNAVLYAGEVDWDAAKLDGKPRRIEFALKSGDSVLVQVSKDPVGHKGARLTSQISLPGRYLVYVPAGSMTGISRKLPDVERNRLKKILKEHLPDKAGVIVRTAAEGASEQELMNDINRLRAQWEGISSAATSTKTRAPELLYSEPDLMIKVVRDVFNEDFSKLVVQGESAWDTIEAYVTYVAPDLLGRLEKWAGDEDVFASLRLDEQIRKALDRKVNLPSGGSLVIDRTEAMTVIDVNTGKFVGSGGNLEETVTKNNLEAAEEIVRQMRLRDMGGIIVVDFIDMVMESNRDLVLRRLVECLGRDRTKHQVAEVTSLGLVQMTRKKIGTGLLEVFSEPCDHCDGRGVVIADEPVEGRKSPQHVHTPSERPTRSERRKSRNGSAEETAQEAQPAEKQAEKPVQTAEEAERAQRARAALATIAAASGHAGEQGDAAHSESKQQGEPVAVGDSEGHGLDDAEDDGRPRRRRRRGRRGRGGRLNEDGTEMENDDAAAPAVVAPVATQPEAVKPAVAEPVSGVARSLSGVERAERADAATAQTAATAGAAANAQAPRRRRRAAASAQGSSATESVRAGEAEGKTLNSAAVAKAPQSPVSSAEPIMLGVGVPASEL
ncbi:Rne/Rng family ribonuclease [Galactobacter caseinivorans]|uniref:Ribonuclease E n=1 Tax=Galactobacter caseinivorans TaxID=2676123 RepID=A0A496PH13_9MICC|nr:Rne/Rng family ribonuclease [Galactobacter caseinivorans]RKW69774.1 ribonuclease E/G [Galactobacter caseinivorans]